MKIFILLSLILSIQSFARSHSTSALGLSQNEISVYASYEQSSNIILLIKSAIAEYKTMNPVKRMYYRSNVKNYLSKLKNKYQDYISQNLLEKSISYINELDYLEMKSPGKAQNYLGQQSKLIDKF